MLPLRDDSLPATPADLAASLKEGLAAVFQMPTTTNPVQVNAPAYPALEQLRIDVTEAAIRADYRPAPASGPRRPGVTVAHFEIVGRPVRYAQAPIFLELSADDARFEITHDANGRPILDPSDARDGKLSVRVGQADLQALLLAAARAAAAAHSVNIESVDVQLRGRGPRSATVELRVTASKKVFLAPVRVIVRGQGTLTIDDLLQATISGLSCQGEGIVGAMVTGMIQDELKQWEGRTIPLTAFSLGSLRLRDLRIDCQNGLNLDATFGR
jgi:hypothetical protein